jgi:hypothetical protein
VAHTGPESSVFTRSGGMTCSDVGHTGAVQSYAVGFARPDRWSIDRPAVHTFPWHAVEAHRPPAELDGEVELAVCGAIVQVWGSQKWARVGAGRTACPRCQQMTAATTPLTTAG